MAVNQQAKDTLKFTLPPPPKTAKTSSPHSCFTTFSKILRKSTFLSIFQTMSCKALVMSLDILFCNFMQHIFPSCCPGSNRVAREYHILTQLQNVTLSLEIQFIIQLDFQIFDFALGGQAFLINIIDQHQVADEAELSVLQLPAG